MKNLFYCLVVSNLFFAEIGAQELNIEKEMVNQISLLGKEKSFAFVDLKLTSEELDLIDQLNFDKLPEGASVQYDRFGDLHLLKEELPNFLKSIGNDNPDVISIVAEVISRTTQNVTSASNKDSAWVCVRASRPNADFDIPRWHMDGAYYGLNGLYPSPEPVFKFAATLKGSPTLLYNLTRDQRDIFNARWDDRQFLSDFLDLSNAETPKRGEGVFFIVANHAIGAAHSEPPMHTNRLFFSILVGNQSEIDELFFRWHPKVFSSN